MDYFIGAAILGLVLLWLTEMDSETIFGGVIVVGLAELVVER